MNTPLYHPDRQNQMGQFYPFTVTIKDVQYSNITGLIGLPCAYQSVAGGMVAEWQTEAPAGDKILLQAYFPAIKAGLRAFLNIGSESTPQWMKFDISDALPTAMGAQMMLVVTPIA